MGVSQGIPGKKQKHLLNKLLYILYIWYVKNKEANGSQAGFLGDCLKKSIRVTKQGINALKCILVPYSLHGRFFILGQA